MREYLDDAAGPATRLVGPTTDPTVAPAHAAVLRLQREAGNDAVSSLMEEEPSPVLDVVGRGGGAALPATTRSSMEAALGADFGGVRVHTDGAAAASARSVQAHAYTVGNDVVLGDGVDPGTAAGQRTLAHELTHVVQQRAGEVDGTAAGGGIRVSDPGDRFEQEAERVADSVTSGRAAEGPAATPTSGLQRDSTGEGAADPEEEPIQAQSLQRETAEDEMQDQDGF
jgi:hypothetical protein